MRAEREILKELGFILYTEHPHKLILSYVRVLTDNPNFDADTRSKLSQYAWNFINDAMRTDACIKYAPEVVCCAALWMGARVLQIKLPSGGDDHPAWWAIFDTRKEDMDAVCKMVTALYALGPTKYVDLPALAPPAAAAPAPAAAPPPAR